MLPLRQEPVPPSRWPLPTRGRTWPESILLWSAVALAFATLGEVLLNPAIRHLTAKDGGWLFLLPAAWLALTSARAFRVLPFDRTAVTVGLFCVLPYLPACAEKHHPSPDTWWVGALLFLMAFVLGLAIDLRRDRTQA